MNKTFKALFNREILRNDDSFYLSERRNVPIEHNLKNDYLLSSQSRRMSSRISSNTCAMLEDAAKSLKAAVGHVNSVPVFPRSVIHCTFCNLNCADGYYIFDHRLV